MKNKPTDETVQKAIRHNNIRLDCNRQELDLLKQSDGIFENDAIVLVESAVEMEEIIQYALQALQDSLRCDHEHDGNMYMSMPPQYKCIKCGEMFKQSPKQNKKGE